MNWDMAWDSHTFPLKNNMCQFLYSGISIMKTTTLIFLIRYDIAIN